MTPDQIATLSPQERIALIDQLWFSLGDGDLPLSPSQSAELDRRLATFDVELPKASSWDDVKAELSARTP